MSEQFSSKARVNQMLRAAAEVLRGQADGLPVREVVTRVKEMVPPTESELTLNDSARERYDTNLRWWSIDLVKAGWLRKSGGRWYLTSVGERALDEYADPQAFGQEANRRYREWKRRDDEQKQSREVWETTDAVLARIPPGRWTTFGDLKEVVQRGTSQIGKHLWFDLPAGWYRVLRSSGAVSADEYNEDRAEEQRGLLASEGVLLDPDPPQDRRLSVTDLRSILAEVTGAPRAWVVRGSSVKGADLVPTWLAEGFVSLAASQLPPVRVDVSDTDLKAAVDSGYDNLGYSQRQAKFEEIRAFLRKVKPGHLVLTTSGADVYVGEIAGDVTQVDSPDGRSNLRRPVDWDNADSPLDVGDLPAQLLGKLRSSADVVDLTDVYDLAAALMPTRSQAESRVDPIVLPAGPLLPDRLPDEVADRLLVGRDWLDELVVLLAERKQIVLFGPPGTGKTFLAQEVAEALAGPERVTLVQFHPAYSYEDFFEGYRPAAGADGQVAFRLVPGPFRKVVDAAREDRDHPYVLIVDEINRANLAKVFGELYFLLEYRDRTIDLMYSSGDEGRQFTLPDNVFVIGTMNTADRSIALVDAAMRRRFAFLSLHPDDDHLAGVLPTWLADRGLPREPALLLAELNRRIPDRDYRIGPSYLMRSSVGDAGGLERIWRTSILPLLEEFHFGDDVDVAKVYGLPTLRRALPAPESADAEETQAPGAPAVVDATPLGDGVESSRETSDS